MKSRYSKILLLTISFTILFLGGRYWFIKSSFAEPYKVAGNIVQEALGNQSQSDYMISEAQWRLVSEDSIYTNIREGFHWSEFKDFVQNCEERSHSSLLYSDGKATYNFAKSQYKDESTIVNIACVDYDGETGGVLEVHDHLLLLEKLNGDWKVVGQSKNEGIRGYNHDETHALEAAKNFVNAIKQKNTDQLLALIKSSNLYSRYDQNYVYKMLEGFEKTFELASLEVVPKEGSEKRLEGQFEFWLKDDNKDRHEGLDVFIVRYESNGDIYYNHPYIRYFPFAEEMVTKYVELVMAKNVEELGQFIKPMDGGPVRVAEDRIASYQNYFGTSNLKVRHEDGFLFIIEDNKGKEHQVEVVMSDGLMIIDDKFNN